MDARIKAGIDLVDKMFLFGRMTNAELTILKTALEEAEDAITKLKAIQTNKEERIENMKQSERECLINNFVEQYQEEYAEKVESELETIMEEKIEEAIRDAAKEKASEIANSIIDEIMEALDEAFDNR